MICSMDLVRKFGEQDALMKENIKMVKNMVKVYSFGLLETHIKVNLWKINLKEGVL
jgi:hypothetical protein